MKRVFVLLFYFISPIILLSQSTYLVSLKSKDLKRSKLSLSPESIDRKLKYHIAIEEKDYTIEDDKMKQLSMIDKNCSASKWLNSVRMTLTEDQLKIVQQLPFVDSILFLKSINSKIKRSSKNTEYSISDYGNTYSQIHIHNGETLHDNGYTGQGMKIAIFDAGFERADSISSLKYSFKNNKIHSIYNFVYPNSYLYSFDGHGTSVLGCMASYIKDTIVGTAPEADYYLFITEDSRSESKVEEFNWALAAEMADSIGVDIINSSLGYNLFDDHNTNYTFSDMDGNTTIVSKAAKIACEKGILVVNSAGNEANKPWGKIIAPADVPKVISVGAINIDATITNFSSKGWNALNVIKPDVVAVGGRATVYYNNSLYYTSNGTSFSSPIMAGLIACFWQQNRWLSSDSLRNILYKSSHLFSTPNQSYGFGIPDFSLASMLVNTLTLDIYSINIYPNPLNEYCIFETYCMNDSVEVIIDLYSFQNKILTQTFWFKKGINTNYIDMKSLAKGIYILRIKTKNSVLERKVEVK